MIKISIIVPVYNVEDYLAKCLNSIISQKDVDKNCFEIIVVNDGSTDNSLSIIQEDFLHLKNVFLISQSNSGLSSARNAGLKYATGEYVWFVDSDDEILNYSLRKLFDIIQHDNHNIVAFNSTLCGVTDMSKLFNRSLYDDGPYTHVDYLNLLYKYPYSGVPFYIFNRNFLLENDLWFKEGLLYEDNLFLPLALFYAKHVFYLNDSLYLYKIRNNSITTRKLTLKNIESMSFVAHQLYDLANVQCSGYFEKRCYFRLAVICYNKNFTNISDGFKTSEIPYRIYIVFHRYIKCLFYSFSFKTLLYLLRYFKFVFKSIC